MTLWIFWAFILVAQNMAFTFVSRARNSASLVRHILAAILSNGVWFVSQLILVSQLLDILTGKYGFWPAVGTGVFYTVFTITGSVLAHKLSLITERGRSAVGANDKYAQITKEDWNWIMETLRVLRLGHPWDYSRGADLPQTETGRFYVGKANY